MKTLLEMLIQIKNAQAAGLEKVSIPFSNLKWEAAKVLKNDKYVGNVEKKKKKINEKSEFTFLEIDMAYNNGEPAITELKFFSKPSRHLYISHKEINSVRGGFNTLLISTSQGLMNGVEAKKKKIGGEIIAGIN
jgi:small subunit ribosomal protein S8